MSEADIEGQIVSTGAEIERIETEMRSLSDYNGCLDKECDIVNEEIEAAREAILVLRLPFGSTTNNNNNSTIEGQLIELEAVSVGFYYKALVAELDWEASKRMALANKMEAMAETLESLVQRYERLIQQQRQDNTSQLR